MSNRPRTDLFQQRKAEGEARNERWAALPVAAKLAALKYRPGASKRQIDKLNGA